MLKQYNGLYNIDYKIQVIQCNECHLERCLSGKCSNRIIRGDMIEVYKIISNIYDSNTSQTILNFIEKNSINLRGHQFTLEHKRLYTPSRVNYFANRVVNNWNSLPDNVVGAGTLNMFKNSLDRLWSKQDLLYNYREAIEKSNYVY